MILHCGRPKAGRLATCLIFPFNLKLLLLLLVLPCQLSDTE